MPSWHGPIRAGSPGTTSRRGNPCKTPSSVADPIILALDQGTTGSTAVALSLDGVVAGKGYREITQHYPQPGWVEHDPEEIWTSVQQAAAEALRAAGRAPAEVSAIGITGNGGAESAARSLPGAPASRRR